jgi:hypothetical protein
MRLRMGEHDGREKKKGRKDEGFGVSELVQRCSP